MYKNKITYFYRKPFPGNYSIEGLFAQISNNLPSEFIVTTHIALHYSKGILNRLLNCVDAFKNRSQINHITGDIHYISLFLPRSNTVLSIHDIEILRRKKGLAYFVIWFFWFYLPVKHLKYVTVISEFTKTNYLMLCVLSPRKLGLSPIASLIN
jgi:hypothetical protein